MRDLRLNLDDITFERLIELARAQIPTLAPLWTDHNLHDPGITLMELFAWNAEAQIYSLGRTRRDEREAYAKLAGVQKHGPTAAEGLIWPDAGVSDPFASTSPSPRAWSAGTVLPAGARARIDRANAPVFGSTHSILLTDATLKRVATRLADNSERDWTATNRQDGARFAPFGADGSGTLVLEFEGGLQTPRPPDAEPVAVSLGVRVVDMSSMNAPDAGGTPLVSLQATLVHLGTRYRLPVQVDTTQGMTRTGVLLLDVSRVKTAITDTFHIELRTSEQPPVRVPIVTRIAADVLPVSERRDEQLGDPLWGTGLPDQLFSLETDAAVQFGAGVPEPKIEIAEPEAYDFSTWAIVCDLSSCEPGEHACAVDWDRGVVTFGNGLNGAMPASRSRIRVQVSVCSGRNGNLPRRLRWRVEGIDGAFGTNPEPMAGGSDGATLDDLRRESRKRLRERHPLVTAEDLRAAAIAISSLQVARAEELTTRIAGAGALPGTRTLMALAARVPGADPGSTPENDLWIAALRKRLAPRMPLGQRLRVIAPRYVLVQVNATLIIRPAANPSVVRDAAVAELQRRFKLVSSNNDSVWPLERDVKARDISGWLRKLTDVIRVARVTLLKDGVVVAGDAISIARTELPLLVIAPDNIAVERGTRGGSR